MSISFEKKLIKRVLINLILYKLNKVIEMVFVLKIIE